MEPHNNNLALDVIIGTSVMITCIVVQCFIVVVQLRVVASSKLAMLRNHPNMWKAFLVMIGHMLALVVGNLIQIAIWAQVFIWIGQFEDFRRAFYFSAVNFSTLGYGDIIMDPEWRLLGALEAVNGILMLGLTTSLLYAVFDNVLLKGWREKFYTRQKDNSV